MISLICLPILFFFSTIENRSKAIHYGSIVVELIPDGNIDPVASSKIESTYVFEGNVESEILDNFSKFCYRIKKDREVVWTMDLPPEFSYNFFIQLVVIVQKNGFNGNVYKNKFVFMYLKPGVVFTRQYEALTTIEELQYIYSEISNRVSAIKNYFKDEPVYTVRIMKYSDLGPPPVIGFPGGIFFIERVPVKDDPKTKILFQEIGNWFIPVFIAWLLLLVLSIKKSVKIVA